MVYKSRTVGVVVPAYNEEKLIGKVLETIPEFVDKIIVVDDCSTDATYSKAKNFSHSLDQRLILLKHQSNQGVGAAVATGYRKALEDGLDVIAVMNADAQMDPEELSKIIEPVVEKRADYTKGNRLRHGEAWKIIPKYRYLGNAALSFLTKIASGYWHVADTQSGYTAISREALQVLPLDGIYKRYGYPNDMLVRLNVENLRVRDVPIKPIYNVGERSDLKLWKAIPALSLLLLGRFFWRLKEKYIIRDFHPLIFFYLMAFVLLIPGITFGIFLVWQRLTLGGVGIPGVILDAVLLISGFQSLFFAMWFDMEYNRDLR